MENRIGFGPRFGAYLIDAVFIFGLAYIIASVFGDSLEALVDFSKMSDEQLDVVSSKPWLWTLSILLPISAVFVGFVYSLIEGFTGQTPGKMMLGLKVGSQDGKAVSIEKYMARFAVKNIGNIFSLIGLAVTVSMLGTIGSVLGVIVFIGCFLVLGEGKLALHDMIVKTAIFKKSVLTANEEN